MLNWILAEATAPGGSVSQWTPLKGDLDTQCWLPVNSAGQHWLVVPVTTCHQEMVLETTVLAVLCELLGVHQQQTALRDTRPNPMVLFSSDVRGRWSGLCETKSL